MRRTRFVLALLVLAAAPLGAQDPFFFSLDGKEPKRPKLEAGTDTNDASAYVAWGHSERTPWKKSFDAYYWAYRLDPTNEAYRLMMYQAVYASQSPEWRNHYIEGAAFVMKSKETKLLDSLITVARYRQPLVNLFASVCRVDRDVLDYYEKSPYWTGQYYFESGCYRQAAEHFGLYLQKNPRHVDTRYNRARALYWSGQPGSALAELQVTLDTLRGRDTKKTSRFYLSKEMLETMRGEFLEAQEDLFGAKKAYAKALEENLAYAPAHVRLARLAMLQGEMNEALQEYDQALQIDDRDPAAHNDYGVALMKVEKWAEAEAHFRRAVELEPHFALPYFNLAVVLDKQAKGAEAATTYRAYVARAPKRQQKNVGIATSRLAALGQAVGSK